MEHVKLLLLLLQAVFQVVCELLAAQTDNTLEGHANSTIFFSTDYEFLIYVGGY